MHGDSSVISTSCTTATMATLGGSANAVDKDNYNAMGAKGVVRASSPSLLGEKSDGVKKKNSLRSCVSDAEKEGGKGGGRGEGQEGGSLLCLVMGGAGVSAGIARRGGVRRGEEGRGEGAVAEDYGVDDEVRAAEQDQGLSLKTWTDPGACVRQSFDDIHGTRTAGVDSSRRVMRCPNY